MVIILWQIIYWLYPTAGESDKTGKKHFGYQQKEIQRYKLHRKNSYMKKKIEI